MSRSSRQISHKATDALSSLSIVVMDCEQCELGLFASPLVGVRLLRVFITRVRVILPKIYSSKVERRVWAEHISH